MILVGIGSNLPSSRFGAPLETGIAAISALVEREIVVLRTSAWYRSEPVPKSDQPDFVNAVVSVETGKAPAELLQTLLGVETAFGRTRTVPNASRVLDLDLLAYNDRVVAEDGLTVPHPRMAERAFVLLPLREIAPDWRHPVSGETIETLISQLPPGQRCERLS